MRHHVDGHLVDAEAATLPVDDRGVTFGDAVGEPVRVDGGTPVAWRAHVDRLLDACDALGFDPGVGDAELRERVDDTLAANGLDDALARLSITRGRTQSSRGPFGRLRPPGRSRADGRGDGRTAVGRPIGRNAPDCSKSAHSPSGGPRGPGLRQAAPPDDDPADEALLLDDSGHVVGGTASDPIMVANDALRLPALAEWPARTATRTVVRELAETEDLPVVDGAYTPADLRAADEVFLAEPTAGVRPVAKIDGVDVGGGPVTQLLAHLFDEGVVAAD